MLLAPSGHRVAQSISDLTVPSASQRAVAWLELGSSERVARFKNPDWLLVNTIATSSLASR
jgi:hypothetical protein